MDLASITIAYVAFGGVLVGFAFSGLCVYLNQQPDSRGQDDSVALLVPRRGDPLVISPIPVSKVASAGFYAMASLAMSTFLYADLAGQDKQRPAAVVTALLPYGILLALSVLTLFYFVTLMMFEHSPTRQAAKPAFWAVTIAGSVVVLRFLAGSARDAERLRCPHTDACIPWIFSGLGIFIILLAAVAVFVFVTLSRILEWRGSREILRRFMNRPDLPPLGVFIVTVAVTTLVSLYINTRPDKYVPPDDLIEWSYCAGVVLVVFFALASGSVVYPRVHDDIRLRSIDVIAGTHSARTRFPAKNILLAVASAILLSLAIWIAYFVESPKLPRADRESSILMTIFIFAAAIVGSFFARDRDRHAAEGRNQTVHLKYMSGTRPSDRNRQLVWAVPAPQTPDAKLTTGFRMSGVRDDTRLRGKLHVSNITSDPSSSDRRMVEITVVDSTGQPIITKRVSTAQGPVELMDSIGRTEALDVVMRRIDKFPETVLLYWREARGEVDTTSRHPSSR